MPPPKDSFVVARTFAAPFVFETIERYVDGDPRAAIEALVSQNRDGIGIFAADAWSTADDYYRDRSPLARWRSNKALVIEGASSIYSEGPDRVEIDGEWHEIDDPKLGRFI
jgi:hypothetical protein